jgi:hypothetical protein
VGITSAIDQRNIREINVVSQLPIISQCDILARPGMWFV